MAKVIVINSDGSRLTRSANELVEMAKSGLITKDTVIEFNGRRVVASKIRELSVLFEQKETGAAVYDGAHSSANVADKNVSDATMPVPTIEPETLYDDRIALPVFQGGKESIAFRKTRINGFAIVALALGVINVLLGVALALHSVSLPETTRLDAVADVTKYDLVGAKFGADFYTAAYEGLDVIVDILDETNSRNALLLETTKQLQASTSDSTQLIVSTMFQVGGLVIVAMGLVLIGGSLIFFKRY